MTESDRSLPGSAARFSEDEISYMRDRTPFTVRTRVMSTLETVMRSLKRRLEGAMAENSYLAPRDVDYHRGKIGTGEYLDGVPYIFLDFPRHITDDESFTYRSLFWWGQGMTFSLVLSGEHLTAYRRKLVENLDVLGALDVHLAVSENPWDWHLGKGHTLPLSGADLPTLEKVFREQAFLKCVRYLALDEDEFRENRIDEAGLYTFRTLEPLILV